jgi:hypothetical protein
LELDVDAERRKEARREQGDLLFLRDVLAPRQEIEEGLLVFIDRARAANVGELAKRVGAVGRTEAAIDAGGELLLGRRSPKVLLPAAIR